jgi:hypothetical protein
MPRSAWKKTGNNLVKTYAIDILCAYPLLPGQDNDGAFNSVCAQHSAVLSQ